MANEPHVKAVNLPYTIAPTVKAVNLSITTAPTVKAVLIGLSFDSLEDYLVAAAKMAGIGRGGETSHVWIG